MYCKYCGKQIENESGICEDCLKKESKDTYFDEPVVAPTVEKNNNSPEYTAKYGFGQALASTIISFIGIIFSFISLEFSALSAGYYIDQSSSILLFLLSLAMGIVSLVFGTKSIGRFKEAKAKRVYPVATLVMGISGVVMAGFVLLFTFFSFILIIATL